MYDLLWCVVDGPNFTESEQGILSFSFQVYYLNIAKRDHRVEIDKYTSGLAHSRQGMTLDVSAARLDLFDLISSTFPRACGWTSKFQKPARLRPNEYTGPKIRMTQTDTFIPSRTLYIVVYSKLPKGKVQTLMRAIISEQSTSDVMRNADPQWRFLTASKR
jgi:hypothetical protein